MKLNKWTVALASVGMISAASVAQAEEKPSSVMTALSSTTISGYVDTSAQWNFGTGNGTLPPYKFGGTSKADGFNLNVVQLRIEKPLDDTMWAAGYRVDLWAGPDANTLNTQSLLNNGTHAANSDFALRQAYVLLRVPYENGIDLKVGVFDSILGYESIESGANPNFTRSYGHGIEPQTHTGMLASYHFTELFSVSAGVANTTGPAINDRTFAPYGTYAESYKTYMGSFSLTAPESFGTLAGSTLYGGVVNGFSSRTIVTDPTTGATVQASQTSYYVGATVATPITGVRCGVAFDDLDVHSDVSGETWAVAGYVTWQATEKLSFHGRAEYLRDRGQQKVYVMQIADPTGAAPPVASQLSPDEVFSWTATMQYDLWKNVLSRVELRWDHACSGGGIYGGSGNSFTNPNTGTEKNAVMLAANIIYKF